MLLDSYTLKTGLTSLLPAPTPAGFVKRVNASFTKIDTLLKTIQVRPSPPEALIQAYLIHIADRSEPNFRRILELKGIRSKQEQNQLVELFHLHRASDRHAPNLQQSNPLFAAVLQQPYSQSSSSSSSGMAGSSVSQGLGLSNLGASAGGSNRFDPSMLGSALISAAKDGVDRFGNQSLAGALGSSSGAGGAGGSSAPGGSSPTPAATSGGGSTSPALLSASAGQGQDGNEGSSSNTLTTTTTTSTTTTGTTGTNLNENLKNIGKFFRRDLGGFGGRFGRGGDDSR